MMHEDLLQRHSRVVLLRPRFVDFTAKQSASPRTTIYVNVAIPKSSFSEFADKFEIADVGTAGKPRLTIAIFFKGDDGHGVSVG